MTFEIKFKEDPAVLAYGGPGWKILKKLKAIEKKKLTPPEPSDAIGGTSWGLSGVNVKYSETNLPLCYKTPMWKWLTDQGVKNDCRLTRKKTTCTHSYHCGCTERITMLEEPLLCTYKQTTYSRRVCALHMKALQWYKGENPYARAKVGDEVLV